MLAPCWYRFRRPDSFLLCQRCRQFDQQRRGRDIREDAIIVDHDGGRHGIAQMACDRELAVVAVAGEAGSLHRARQVAIASSDAVTFKRFILVWKSSDSSSRGSLTAASYRVSAD